MRPQKSVLFIWATLSVFVSPKLALADQIVMKNGDRVTGNIVKKDGKSVSIKSEQFGLITAAWDQVQSISADKPLTVVLQDGKTVQGTVATTAGNVEVIT